MKGYLLTSESVTEGHPDKLCDQVSDSILDAIMQQDPFARVACETATTTNLVVLLGEGRLVNLAAAEGHPPSVMDMSFANQALASEYIVKNHTDFNNEVYTLPKSVDQQIAALKIRSFGKNFDKLKSKQEKYLNSWELGTGSSQEGLE